MRGISRNPHLHHISAYSYTLTAGQLCTIKSSQKSEQSTPILIQHSPHSQKQIVSCSCIQSCSTNRPCNTAERLLSIRNSALSILSYRDAMRLSCSHRNVTFYTTKILGRFRKREQKEYHSMEKAANTWTIHRYQLIHRDSSTRYMRTTSVKFVAASSRPHHSATAETTELASESETSSRPSHAD